MIIEKLRSLTNRPTNVFEEEIEKDLLDFSQTVSTFSKEIFFPNIKTVTSSQDIGIESIYLVNSTGGEVVITLKNASRSGSRIYWFKKIDASANNMKIETDGSETIDGAANITTNTQYDSFCIVTDKSNWFIINDK